MIRLNPRGEYPQADETAYIDPTAVIIGQVDIGKKVFIAPGAILRADEEGSSIIIQDNCNVQDRVIIHALANTSVLIGVNTSLAHGCIIHGPCKISRDCFIGFGSVVFNAEIGEEVFIKHLAVVEGVPVPAERVVESHTLVESEDGAKKLRTIDHDLKKFAQKVLRTNLDLVERYLKG